MRFVLFMICMFLAMDGVVWICFDRTVRNFRRARLWRGLVAGFMGVVFLFLLANLFTMHLLAHWHEEMPISLMGTMFIWHFLVLPLTLIALLITGSVRKIGTTPIPFGPAIVAGMGEVVEPSCH